MVLNLWVTSPFLILRANKLENFKSVSEVDIMDNPLLDEAGTGK